jgi:tol-pal system protein YbgF
LATLLHRCRAAGLLIGLVPLAGCATRADLLQVKQDQREVRALLADQQVAVEGLRRRLEMVRDTSDSPGGRRGGALPNEVKQRLNDLDARVNALEQARASAPAPPLPAAAIDRIPLEPGRPGEAPPARPGEPPAIKPAEAPPPAAAKPSSPQDVALAREESALQGVRVDPDYREALELIRQGQCSQGVPKLRDFLRKNPKSDLADNAQYWIGSCYYGQHDYNRAIIELNEVLLKYPKADKVPAALLMLADAFADSGDKIDARLILQKLLSDHPRTEEAERGRQKLQSLGD